MTIFETLTALARPMRSGLGWRRAHAGPTIDAPMRETYGTFDPGAGVKNRWTEAKEAT